MPRKNVDFVYEISAPVSRGSHRLIAGIKEISSRAASMQR